MTIVNLKLWFLILIALFMVIPSTDGATVNLALDEASELIKLAEKKFGNLTETEKKLFRDTSNGESADYSSENDEDNDPAKAEKWDSERVLRADRIAWLCLDKLASQFVKYHGIEIKGARIDEIFFLQHAKISFPLCFNHCKFTADINLINVQIPGLNMLGTHTDSILADFIKTDGPILLQNGFNAQGEVRLIGATVGGNLECDNSTFTNKDGKAFSADGLNVDGSIFFRNGFRAEGEVRLLGATVGQDFGCTNGQFINEGGRALLADGLKVDGAVFFSDGFRAEGEVRLLEATIGRNLECDNGQFINQGDRAITADGLEVEGCISFRDRFKADGEVRLLGATVGGDIICVNGQMTNKNGIAFFADGLKVEGAIFIRNCRIEGIVSLIAATIRTYLELTGIESPEKMALDLSSAKIGTLHDEQKSWPKTGRLFLHGMEYAEICSESPRDSKTRIEWLRLQRDFSHQPYEQLAEVLRKSGDDVGALDVMIAKNKDKAILTKLTRSQWIWYHLFGPLIGYGYRPWLAIPWALILIFIGWFFFKKGYSHGLITPLSDSAYTKEKNSYADPYDKNLRISKVYPTFNSLIYSIDVFIPLVDLYQVKYWLPNANRSCKSKRRILAALYKGRTLLIWLWIETILGWILMTLFLVSLTGLVRT